MSVVDVLSPQPIGGEEDDGAVQPNPQPSRAEPAVASATTNPPDASKIAAEAEAESRRGPRLL
jgi:hypothetical protein